MRRAEAAAEDLGRERDVLLEELRGAQQVRFGLERAREELQRQLAGADGQLHILQVRQRPRRLRVCLRAPPAAWCPCSPCACRGRMHASLHACVLPASA